MSTSVAYILVVVVIGIIVYAMPHIEIWLDDRKMDEIERQQAEKDGKK